jgi:hypothetical protein
MPATTRSAYSPCQRRCALAPAPGQFPLQAPCPIHRWCRCGRVVTWPAMAEFCHRQASRRCGPRLNAALGMPSRGFPALSLRPVGLRQSTALSQTLHFCVASVAVTAWSRGPGLTKLGSFPTWLTTAGRHTRAHRRSLMAVVTPCRNGWQNSALSNALSVDVAPYQPTQRVHMEQVIHLGKKQQLRTRLLGAQASGFAFGLRW